MPKFEQMPTGPEEEAVPEKEIPPFEDDTFEYEKEAAAEKPEEKIEVMPEEKKEIKEEEPEAVEEPEEAAEPETKEKRFSGIRGFFGKAAMAAAAIFGGQKEAETAEPPAKPAAEYRVPGFNLDALRPQEKPPVRNEIIVTSKSLGDMLGARDTKDLGKGRYSLRLHGKKYEIGQEELARMAEIKMKYQYLHGRTKLQARAEAMAKMREDLKSVVMQSKNEVPDDRPARKTATSLRAEKEAGGMETAPAKKKAKRTDYSKDAGAYDNMKK